MYLKWYGDTVGATTAVGAVQLCSAPFVVLYTYNRVSACRDRIGICASLHYADQRPYIIATVATPSIDNS